jgi:hypothetical protein
MSIQTFKKKGLLTCHGVKQSAKPGPGIWLRQGPFGANDNIVGAYGKEGFSINGGTRNVGYIGKHSMMSKSGTPYSGQCAIGNGGSNGRYYIAEPLLNMPLVRCDTQGRQYQFIKQSVLSNKGMLERKYKWIHNGQYPNHWVQPQQCNDNMSNNASQLVYVQNLAAANTCVDDTNKPEVYATNYKCNAIGCDNKKTANYNNYNNRASAGLYSKTLRIPETSSQYTLQVQRKCQNQTDAQKPFPFAVASGSGSGIGSNNTGQQNSTTGPPPPISTPIFLTP